MAANIISLPNSAELLRARYTPSAPSHYGYQHLANVLCLLSVEQQDKPASSSEAGNLHQQFKQRVQHPNGRYQIRQASLNAPPPSAAGARLPAYKALAARLAAAAARQARKQQQEQRNQNTWSVDLASDIAAICQELGLPQGAARAVTAAAQKRQVSANPGVLLCQMVRLLPLDNAFGSQGSVGKLLSVMPTLLRSDPDTLLQSFAAVQGVLARDCTAAVIMKQPQLLTCSPFRLQTNFAQLQELLAFSPAAAAAAAADQPVLLLASPRSLQQRLDVLRNTLFSAVPEDLLLKHLRRSPGLLLLRPSTVAAKLHCLGAVFKLSGITAVAESGDQAVLAAAEAEAEEQQQLQHKAQPVSQQQQQQDGLEGRDQLAAALARLKAASEVRLQRAPDQHQQHARYRHWLSQQQQQHTASSCSSSSDARVQQLVLKVPGLLCLTSATLQLHVTELQLLLGLQPDDAALQRIIQLQPGLLTQAPATLANKLQLLQYLTGRSESAVQEMVLRCPAILTLSVASVTCKWELLNSCVACCKEWQQQLQKASHVTVAMALCYSEKRLLRLQDVVQLYMEHGALDGSSSSNSTTGQAAEAVGAAAASSSSNSKPSSISKITRSPEKASCAMPQKGDAGWTLQRRKRQQQQQQQGLAAVPWRAIIQESDAAFAKRYAGLAARWGKHQQQ